MKKKIICIGIVSMFLFAGLISMSVLGMQTKNNSDTVSLDVYVDYNILALSPVVHAVVTVECEETDWKRTLTRGSFPVGMIVEWYGFELPIPDTGTYTYNIHATWLGQEKDETTTVEYDHDSNEDIPIGIDFKGRITSKSFQSSLPNFLHNYPLIYQVIQKLQAL